MNKPGKFIVFEGGEGTGKTTCSRAMFEVLTQRGYPVVWTREPGGTKFGEKIRGIFLSAKQEEGGIDILAQILLVEAARVQHLKQVILPALEAGKIVLCDRFSASTYAYQIAGEERFDLGHTFRVIDAHARGVRKKTDSVLEDALMPTLVIFLDGDPAVCLQRMQGRGEELTRFDAQKLEFHKRVREGFLDFFRYYKGHQKCIDALGSMDEVHALALDAILQVL